MSAKLLKVGIAVLVVLLVIGFALPTLAATNKVFVTPAYQSANIRREPGLMHDILATAKTGEQIEAIGRTNFDPTATCTGISAVDNAMWLRVSYSGVQGWMARCTVSVVSGNLANLPVVLTPEELFKTAHSVTVEVASADVVNIRSGPGPEYTIIGLLRPESLLAATGRNNNDPTPNCGGTLASQMSAWLRLDMGELEGWVSYCAVKMNGKLTDLPIVQPTTPMHTHDVRWFVNPIEGLPELTFERYSGFTTIETVVHSSPGLTSPILGSVPFGETVWMTGRSPEGGWLKIMYRGQEGWVAAHLLAFHESEVFALPIVQ